MRIVYGNVVVADPAAGLPLYALSINGARVVELVDFARATAKRAYARGNTATTLQMQTSATFATYADAEDYALLLESSLPQTGVLTITQTGAAAGRASVTLPNAALTAVVPVLSGVRVDVTLSFAGGRFQGGSIPGYVTDPDSPNTMLITTPIPSGADSVAIDFPAAATNPVVAGVSIVLPDGATESPGILGVRDLSTDGATVFLTGPVPADGYVLHAEVKNRS